MCREKENIWLSPIPPSPTVLCPQFLSEYPAIRLLFNSEGPITAFLFPEL